MSFNGEDDMAACLGSRVLSRWFFEVRAWEESDLADGSIRWVCMKGVPIPLWNYYQFFTFAVAGFGSLGGYAGEA